MALTYVDFDYQLLTKDNKYRSYVRTIDNGSIFKDDLSTSDLTKSENGVSWGSAQIRTGDTVTVAAAPGGGNGIRFFKEGQADFEADNWAELPYDFGGEQYSEVWIKFRQYIPADYAHRGIRTLTITILTGTFNVGDSITKDGSSPTESGVVAEVLTTPDRIKVRMLDPDLQAFAVASGDITNGTVTGTATITASTLTASNNKTIQQLWTGAYGTTNVDQYAGLEVMPNPTEGSYVAYRSITGAATHPNTPIWDSFQTTVKDFDYVDTATDLGTWITVVAQSKIATGLAVGDGELKIWKNGTLIVDVQAEESGTLDNWNPTGINYYEKAYIMGWDNSGWDVDTVVWIADFEVALGNNFGVTE